MGRSDSEGPILPLDLNDWPRSGLPWSAFWLKELLAWGTLDPVAAFLLARGDAIDRSSAEAEADNYYAWLSVEERSDLNGMIDPRRVREWIEIRRPAADLPKTEHAEAFLISIDLAHEPANYNQNFIEVFPLMEEDRLAWIDPAGYLVGKSKVPPRWPENPAQFEFKLDVDSREISGRLYLEHAHLIGRVVR